MAFEFSGGTPNVGGGVGLYSTETGIPLKSGVLSAPAGSLIFALFTARNSSEPSGLSYPPGFTGLGLETDGSTYVLGGAAYQITAGAYSSDTQWASNTTDGWAAAQLAMSPSAG
jgi:hypothetical protein